MRESLLLHSTNIVVYPNILLFMGLHYFISFAVFVVQFSRCVFTMTAVCQSCFLLDSFNLLVLILRGRSCSVCRSFWLGVFYFIRRLVGTSGFEPPTSRLSGVRSNHLSYEPISLEWLSVLFPQPVVEMRRIELLTPCVQGRCSPS